MLPAWYVFHNPVKIVSGEKALEELPSELAALGARKPLVVTDKGVSDAGLLKKVLDVFDGTGIGPGAVYDSTPPDSSLECVREAAALYVKFNCDSFLAVGGGSPADTAKAANILVTEKAVDLLAFSGVETLQNPLKPLIILPTTAGTGSEVTSVAVITNTAKNIKMAFKSHHLFPRLALLDPRLTATLPPRMTAATGMDALAHAMESCISVQKNPLSDAHAWAAVTLIRENLIPAIVDGKNTSARLAMANAAMLAGAAFSNSMVGIVHSLGHAAGGECHIPHGLAMSIFLPVGLEFNLSASSRETGELLLPLAGPEVYAGTPAQERPGAVIKQVRNLKDRLHELTGLPRTLSEAGVERSMLPKIAQKAMLDGSLSMNPAEASLEEVADLVQKAW